MQLDISLDKSARRPIARLEWFSGCRALIDTGALFPVWTKSESLLIKLGGKIERNNISFSGFGGKTNGQLYRVNFNLNGLQYIDMPVVVKPMNDLNCHINIFTHDVSFYCCQGHRHHKACAGLNSTCA